MTYLVRTGMLKLTVSAMLRGQCPTSPTHIGALRTIHTIHDAQRIRLTGTKRWTEQTRIVM